MTFLHCKNIAPRINIYIFDINFEVRRFENKFNENDEKRGKLFPNVSIEVELATKFSEGQGKISISGKCT